MPKSIPVALFDQQYGFSTTNSSDILFHRLKCTSKNVYRQMLPQEYDIYNKDTPIFACKFSPKAGSEHLVALANEDGKLAIHNTDENSRHGAQAHNNAIFDLAWMFDQLKIVSASGDHTLKLFDAGNGDVVEEKAFYGHVRSVKTVAFRTNDSSVFASGGRDGNIILWDIRSERNSFVGKADQTIIQSHVTKMLTPKKVANKWNSPSTGIKSVTGLAFRDDNTLISCGAGDGLIKVWDLRKNYCATKHSLPMCVIPYSGNTSKNGFSSLTVNDNGTKLYANCLDNTIYCYNIATCNPEPIMRYYGHQNSTFYIKSCLCKDGKYLISGSSDENAYIWNTKDSYPHFKLTGHTAEVTCVAWCRKSHSLVTCSDDMTHKIWTINKDCSDDEGEATLYGSVEVLPLNPQNSKKVPLKRSQKIVQDENSKKLLIECKRCKAIGVLPLCDNCNCKRKAEDVEDHDQLFCKRVCKDLGPKRLFGESINNIEPLATLLEETEPEPPSKTMKLSTPEPKSPLSNSPSLNLPNFIVDGTAPHLNYSPPKRKAQDWLTRLRIEKMLHQEMLSKTEGLSSPKSPRLDSTPKSKKDWTSKSPLLRFFKVTNSSSKPSDSSKSYEGSNNMVFAPP